MKVRIKTNMGNLALTLFPEKAPNTVNNFKAYVDDGFYAGTIFHRVIQDFMIQGGGFESGMQKKPFDRAPIKNEANNGLKNLRGTIAMARTNDPHSATSQFFINSVDNPNLDFKNENDSGWGYCVFGELTEGEDVLDKISGLKTTLVDYHRDVPEEEVIIHSVSID